jgi:hypothetical protein
VKEKKDVLKSSDALSYSFENLHPTEYQSMSLFLFYFGFIWFFWQHWDLNSGPQAFLPLEPLHQPFFVIGFFEIGSCALFAPGWL